MLISALQLLGHKSYPFQIHPPSYSLEKEAEADIQKADSQFNLFDMVGLPCSHLLDFQWYSFQASGNWSSFEKECPQKEMILQHTFFPAFCLNQDEYILFLAHLVA